MKFKARADSTFRGRTQLDFDFTNGTYSSTKTCSVQYSASQVGTNFLRNRQQHDGQHEHHLKSDTTSVAWGCLSFTCQRPPVLSEFEASVCPPVVTSVTTNSYCKHFLLYVCDADVVGSKKRDFNQLAVPLAGQLLTANPALTQPYISYQSRLAST